MNSENDFGALLSDRALDDNDHLTAVVPAPQFADPLGTARVVSAAAALSAHRAFADAQDAQDAQSDGDPSGQLWIGFGGPGTGTSDGHSDFRVIAADSDGTAVIKNEQASTGLYQAVGLDTSAGLFISLDNTYHLRITNIVTGADLSSTVVASTADQDLMNAFAVNADTNTIFAGLFGYDYLADGGDIIKITYNQTTGAIVSPYSWNDTTHAFSINLNNVLIDSTSTGHVYADARSMQLSADKNTLYYVDDNDNDPGNFWGFGTNGIFRVSTSGSVGGGNAPTPVLLSLQSQFPVNDSNGYISSLAVDEARGIIYFTTNSTAPGVNAAQNGIWWIPIAGGTATKMTPPGGVSVTYPVFIGQSLALDVRNHLLYYSDQSTGIISALTLSGDGHTFTGGSTFLNVDTNANTEWAGALTYDDLPTLAALAGTTTEAVQGGSALTLLTAVPSITDTDNLRLHHFTIGIANAQAGDNLYVNGQQSGTISGVTLSWNGTTHQLTLSGDVALGTYQTLLSQVTYQDAGTDNSTGSHPTRTINWTASDGTVIVNPTASDPNQKTTTVTIDRAPTLTADGYSVVETSTVTGTSGTAGTGVLGNDNDKDADAIAVTAVNGSGGNVGNVVVGTYGHLTLNANGSYSYIADNAAQIAVAANGSHPVDTFTYTVSDGLGGVTSSTVSFTIDRIPTVVADAPAGQALEGGAAVTGNVLSNDSDRDGDTLTVSAVNGSGGNVGNAIAGTYGHITIGSNGAYSYTADNTVAIDAAAQGSHLTDTFTYTANDGHGGTATQTITATIDRAPTVVSDAPASQAVESGVAVTGNVLTNDSDRDGDTLVVSVVSGSAGNVGNSVATAFGHITINANGSYSYTADNTVAIDALPTGSHRTEATSYTASDGHGGTNTINVVVTIDRGPTAVADAPAGQAVESGVAVTGNVLTNDSDRDGDSLTVSAVAGSGGNVGNSVATTYGHITINADGSYSYTADNTVAIDAAAQGSHLTDSATYTASDGFGGTSTTTVTITLDRAPTVTADAPAGQALESGAAITGNVLTNDSDRDGDSLTVLAVNGSGGNVGNAIAGTYGHITLNADGSYSYAADNTVTIDAAAQGSHLTDAFTYTANDGHGGTATQTITITLDRAPTAVADAPAGQVAVGGAAVTGNVLTNDSDRDGDSLTVSAVAGSGGNVGNSVATTYGHITINADGSYSYTADNTAAIDAAPVGSHPTDVFTYTASDGHGGTADATLSFTIDRPPLAHDDAFTTDELTAIGAGLSLFDNNGSGADLDPDGAGSPALVVSAVTGGTLGTQFALPSGALLTVNADGSFAYDPNHAFDSLHLAAPGTGAANTSTTDTFTYTLANGGTATATVTVNGINNANTIYEGSGGSDVITGDATLGGLYHLEQGGEDNVTGGSANDGFYFGAEFTAGDIVNGGGGSNNQIGLEGDYTAGVILSGSEITGIQTIAMLPGFDYTLSTDGTLTTAGQAFSFWSVKLGSGNHVNIDVHLEAGNISFFLGQGDDIAIGGSGTDLFFGEGGADTLTGNGGADTFAYFSTTTDSNGAGGTAYDTITDFTAGTDKIELFGTHVSTVDTAVSGDLSAGTFDSDLAAVLGNGATGQLNQGHAVLFTATGGGLSGETFLIVGTAGAASGYTAAADYVIHLQGAGFAALTPTDFV